MCTCPRRDKSFQPAPLIVKSNEFFEYLEDLLMHPWHLDGAQRASAQ